MSDTTIRVSGALDSELSRLRDDVFGLDSADATIRRLLREPRDGDRRIDGDADVLDHRVKVRNSTRSTLRSIMEREGFDNYENVIRDRAGLQLRDEREEPIDYGPIDA